MTINAVNPLGATVLGAARIGPNRELKKAIEALWSGKSDKAALEQVAAGLRADAWAAQKAAGLASIPVNTFSYYDQILDTAVLLGALPPRVAEIADPLTKYFAAARGADGITPLEMTKWFDTNYHYIVPELTAETRFSLNADKVLGELAEAQAQGINARPVVVGPLTFLRLSKVVDESGAALDRVAELIPLYVELLAKLKAAGAEWVQIDEPILVKDVDEALLGAVSAVYGELAGQTDRPAILVATYFGSAEESLPLLKAAGVEGVAVDLVSGTAPAADLSGLHVLAGVVDGRNIWRTDLDAALEKARGLAAVSASVSISSSSSLLHVPYTLRAETGLDDALRSWLAFGEEKVAEIVAIATAFAGDADSVAPAFEAARTALDGRRHDPRLSVAAVREELERVRQARQRATSAEKRREIQSAELGLPPLPTTTIGSYPQTSRIRVARADLRKGVITQEEYTQRMREEVAEVIALQEDLDIDVLVHGEPERNDMVQYFAEQLEGFFATQNGWVQSYGTRCVRPPILFGDVVRPNPMTVEWFEYAQSLTARPVKGMLTGPVTILAWSFVRDDQPLSDSADQVALAIRQETIDLEAAGARVIQVDEPALRELLPLRKADQTAYLEWAVGAFRLSTSGVVDKTQIHTHLCYSEFGEVIGAIAALDADVTSIEAARSRMEILEDLRDGGYDLGVGPGVYDIHSPRVPSVDEIVELLRAAVKTVPVELLWVNPDCGLKTRGNTEVKASLQNLVTAAKLVREELPA